MFSIVKSWGVTFWRLTSAQSSGAETVAPAPSKARPPICRACSENDRHRRYRAGAS
jgi:hypothetical protein